MKQSTEFIRVYLDSLIEAHKKSCICFTTDKEKYTYISRYGADAERMGSGRPFFKGGLIEKCILEKKTVVASLNYEGYGEIIKGCLWPITEYGETKGVYGIVLPGLSGCGDIVGVWLRLPVSGAAVNIHTIDKIEFRFHLSKKEPSSKSVQKTNSGLQ
ncbi:MAG: hypothetical protein HPY50_08820 [Firmicutes bacterium]|nr:hypothetical protein [Bacillota bacterium]